MSLLSEGAELRKRMRGSAFGQSILYKRGSTLSAAITARPTIADHEIDNGVASVYFQSMDFVFDVEQAVWSQNSQAFTPLVMDIIVYEGKSYEVTADGSGQHFTNSDHRRLSWRINTKEVSDA